MKSTTLTTQDELEEDSVSAKIAHTAEEKAFAEYDEFNKTQKIESDFDREMKRVFGNARGKII